MKKILLIYILLICSVCYASTWNENDSVPQPILIVGRMMNQEGQCLSEKTTKLQYNKKGQLTNANSYPSFVSFSYYDNYLCQEHISHYMNPGTFNVTDTYTYHDGQLVLLNHVSPFTISQQTRYTYDELGNLIKTDIKEGFDLDEYYHYQYEYDNHGRTKIESYYTGYENPVVLSAQGLTLQKRTTYRYDNRLFLTEQETETFDKGGNVIKHERTRIAYSNNNIKTSETTQTLVGKQWVNTGIIQVVFDKDGLAKERMTGIWSETKGAWEYNHKVVYEYDSAGCCRRVSFFQWEEEQWVWSCFDGNPVWFNNLYDLPFEVLRQLYLAWGSDDDFPANQFEITYSNTVIPVYHITDTYTPLLCEVFPNPGSDIVTVSASLENGIIRFYDTQGRMVYEAPFDFRANINTGDWTAGIYVWEIWRDSLRKAYGKWVKK